MPIPTIADLAGHLYSEPSNLASLASNGGKMKPSGDGENNAPLGNHSRDNLS